MHGWAGSDRIANKNPIRVGRTGLDAVTRLRMGELRFRKRQNANVHHFDVAGGGPFFTARCRDRLTHSIPQESSAGRNLITVFRHVNNLVQFFLAAVWVGASSIGAIARRRSASRLFDAQLRCAHRARKARKKRHFA
ncbi:MAG TPA: hypothetical protein VGQ93_06670 [Lysobacter sp.]|nr:hypothetical protein [Lysobacter sp.]